jgi:hypothetical protein
VNHLSVLILPLVVATLVSCAGDNKEASTASNAPLPFSQRINEKAGFSQDSEGNWKPRVNRRSSFESKGESPYFTGDFAKKQWLGGKAVEKKAYLGDTDGNRFAKASNFTQQRAHETSRGAREGGQPARETRGTAYATGEAYESGVKPVKTSADADAMARRKTYPQPEIIDWQQQRALSVEQTKGILGRE